MLTDLDYNNKTYDNSTKQDIIINYCSRILENYDSKYKTFVLKLLQNKIIVEISQEFDELLLVYRVFIIFVKLILQLNENEIEWQTIQTLSNILQKFYYFYYFGYIIHFNEMSLECNKQNIGITWREFCQLQQVIILLSLLSLFV